MAGRCDCAKTCACAMTGSGTVSMSGSGAAAQPYVMAVRRRPGQANALEVFEAGDPSPGVAVYMRVRDANGDELDVSDDGYVTIPGSTTGPSSDLTFGPGFGDEAGLITLDVNEAWPVNDVTGQPLVGSAANFDSFMGKLVVAASGLYALPDHTTVRAGSGVTLETPGGLGQAIATTYTTAGSFIWSITNPSPSRRMLVTRHMAVTADVSTPVDSRCVVQLQQRLNGGTYTAQRTLTWPSATEGTQNIVFDGEITKSDSSTLAPGATLTVQLRIVFTKQGTGTNPVFLNSSAACELVGVTI